MLLGLGREADYLFSDNGFELETMVKTCIKKYLILPTGGFYRLDVIEYILKTQKINTRELRLLYILLSYKGLLGMFNIGYIPNTVTERENPLSDTCIVKKVTSTGVKIYKLLFSKGVFVDGEDLKRVLDIDYIYIEKALLEDNLNIQGLDCMAYKFNFKGDVTYGYNIHIIKNMLVCYFNTLLNGNLSDRATKRLDALIALDKEI